MALEVVIDGTDGAGKTSFLAHLAHRLRAKGDTVAVYAPFRQREVYPLWEAAPGQAAAIIAGIMAEQRARSQPDVLLWDRGWPTVWVSTTHEWARGCMEPMPHLTVLMLSTRARARAKGRAEGAGVWVTEEPLVQRFTTAYHALQGPTHPILRFVPDPAERFDFDAMGGQVLSALATLRTDGAS